MKITRDEAGQLLELSGETIRLPAALGWVGVVAALGALAHVIYDFVAPFRGPVPPDELEIVLSGLTAVFWVAVVSAAVRFVARRRWRFAGLRVDGRSGELTLVDRHIFGGRERTEKVPLPRLVGLNLEMVAMDAANPPTLDALVQVLGQVAASNPEKVPRRSARLTLRIDQGRRRPRARRFDLDVEGLDSREEIADLAYRLGAAGGLLYQRVVRSDQRQMEIEFRRAAATGFALAPKVEGRADYAHDQVTAAATAVAARETIPPFDPKQFLSDHQVRVWEPRREVRFQKPLGFMAIGCLPVAVFGFALGPWFYVMALRPGATQSGSPLVGAFVVGFFGVAFALVACLVIAGSLPHRTVVDWSARTISEGGWFKRREIAFSDVAALMVKCVHTHHSGSKNTSSWEGYKCELRAELRSAASGSEPVLLVETNEWHADPDTPYRQALPLATELAEALGVPRRVTEYT